MKKKEIASTTEKNTVIAISEGDDGKNGLRSNGDCPVIARKGSHTRRPTHKTKIAAQHAEIRAYDRSRPITKITKPAAIPKAPI
jgi:hypothetical protein